MSVNTYNDIISDVSRAHNNNLRFVINGNHYISVDRAIGTMDNFNRQTAKVESSRTLSEALINSRVAGGALASHLASIGLAYDSRAVSDLPISKTIVESRSLRKQFVAGFGESLNQFWGESWSSKQHFEHRIKNERMANVLSASMRNRQERSIELGY